MILALRTAIGFSLSYIGFEYLFFDVCMQLVVTLNALLPLFDFGGATVAILENTPELRGKMGVWESVKL